MRNHILQALQIEQKQATQESKDISKAFPNNETLALYILTGHVSATDTHSVGVLPLFYYSYHYSYHISMLVVSPD